MTIIIEGILDEQGHIIPEKWEEFQQAEIAKLEALRNATPTPTLEDLQAQIAQLQQQISNLLGS